MSVTPGQAVDAANRAFGRHPGSRALHAKGILCTGTFRASTGAAALTTAAHMQNEPVQATVRFSNAAGNPRRGDYAPDLRGMAIKFYLPDGSRTDIVAVSTPLFAAGTKEVFVELLEAQGAGAAAAVKLPLLFARHPRLLAASAQSAREMRPISSYASIRYYAQHAFRWVDGGGVARYVRYTLVPETGEEPHVGLRAARARGRDYLQDDLRDRLARGSVRFTLELQIAEAGDPVEDASRAWPPERKRVTAGVLELTGVDTEREKGDDVLVFDPTRVTTGIDCSEDPVLLFRSPAYRESVSRRMGG